MFRDSYIISTVLKISNVVVRNDKLCKKYGTWRVKSGFLSAGNIEYRSYYIGSKKILLVKGTHMLSNWLATLDTRRASILFQSKLHYTHNGHLEAYHQFYSDVNLNFFKYDLIIGHSFGASMLFLAVVHGHVEPSKIRLLGIPCFHHPDLVKAVDVEIIQMERDIITHVGPYSHLEYINYITLETINGSNWIPGYNHFAEVYSNMSISKKVKRRSRLQNFIESPANFFSLVILKLMEVIVLSVHFSVEIIMYFFLWVLF